MSKRYSRYSDEELVAALRQTDARLREACEARAVCEPHRAAYWRHQARNLGQKKGRILAHLRARNLLHELR